MRKEDDDEDEPHDKASSGRGRTRPVVVKRKDRAGPQQPANKNKKRRTTSTETPTDRPSLPPRESTGAVSQDTILTVLSADIPEGGFEKCPRKKKETILGRKERRPTWMGPPLTRPLRWRYRRRWTLQDLMKHKAVEKKQSEQNGRNSKRD
jgi:hypothetical protein